MYFNRECTNKKLGLERIMENKVEFGKYQKRALLFLSLVDLNDGAELILMTIILPILQLQFNLDTFQIQVLSSIFYCGMFLGAYSSGMLADRYGRRVTIIISQFIQGLTALFFANLNWYPQLVIFRLIYGIVYGFSLPLSTTMYSEISPLKYRGKGLVCINSAVGLGKLYGVFLAFLIMDDIHSGNWRLLVIISSLPSFIVAYGVQKYLYESPRYLLAQNKQEQLIYVLNSMIEVNKKDGADVIDEKDQSELRLQNSLLFDSSEPLKTKVLFQGSNKQITIRIWIMWFFLHTMSKGQLLILPFIVGIHESKDMSSIVFTILGEVPAMILACMLVDEAKYFGRKKTTIIFFLLAALSNLFCGLDILFPISMALGRFCYREVSSMLYTFTTEVYQTNYRVLGIGWATGMGRLGTCIMPFYLFPLMEINSLYPFYLFVIFSLVSGYCAYTLPVDTTGKHLDTVMVEFQQITEKRRNSNLAQLYLNQDLELKNPSSISSIPQSLLENSDP